MQDSATPNPTHPYLPGHGRYPFSRIDQRKDYSWPGGRRLAFYTCLNIEIFAFGAGKGADVGLANPGPNQRSYAWRDYGNRVGLTRLLGLFEELQLPLAHNVNAWAYEIIPEIFEPIRRRGDEIIGHGRTNSESQALLWERDEAGLIEEASRIIETHEGKRPAGWLGPWLAESWTTPDLLQEAGYRYLLDWACDDQPIWMKTRNGRILSIPYPVELNDSPAIVFRNYSAEDFADMIVDQFDEMSRQSEDQPLVMPLALHTFIMGQPFRLKHLRRALQHCMRSSQQDKVWFTRPGDIADHCYSLETRTIPE